MATTRIMPLHIGKGRTESTAISDIIDYVANPQKTDNGRLVTGYECDSRIADTEFVMAKRQYIAITGRVRGKDDVIAYHVRQSFRPVKSRRKKPTGWEWNLPNGLPKATTPLLSALTLTKPMCIITLFGVRSIWTVTENSETSGAVQRLLGV